jgi:hypothetical protein
MIKLKEAKEKKLEMERSKTKEKELESCTFKPKIIEFNSSIIDRTDILKNLVNQVNYYKKSPQTDIELFNQFEEPE